MTVRGCALIGALGWAISSMALAAQAPDIQPVEVLPALRPLAFTVTGRAQRISVAEGEAGADFGGQSFAFQWPDVYFETAFQGSEVYFRLGKNPPHIRLVLDGSDTWDESDEAPGAYALRRLPPGEHHLRLLVISESRNGPSVFEGFAITAGEQAMPASVPARQMEFIGDSHTVGYGNALKKAACTPEEVWAATDAAKAFAPRVAAHYGAAYEVNAISGRGVVRNYNGGQGDTLPAVYPYVLFDKNQVYTDATWKPQVVVTALGTNDFSTPLHAGESWKTREALHADFERSYVRFLTSLRERNPTALLVVWATGEDEIVQEAGRAVERAKASGEKHITFVHVDGLEFSGCNSHPSIADDGVIAAKLEQAIDGETGVWPEE